MAFELHPSPMKNDEGENLLYVKPMKGKNVTLDELDQHCTENSGLTRHTLTSVFNYFATACAEFLAEGNSIKTPMGVFSPRLSLKGEFTDPSKVGVNDVEWRGVEFQPSKQFMKQIKDRSRGFLRAPGCKRTNAKPSDAQLQKALDRSIADLGGYTTIRSFGFFAVLSDFSSRKYLNGLCSGDAPLLQRQKIGGQWIYKKL